MAKHDHIDTAIGLAYFVSSRNLSRTMFTGIVQGTGIVATAGPAEETGDLRLQITLDGDMVGPIHPGDSVAVNGVCLTASSVNGDRFTADVSAETISCTTTGNLRTGMRVNLETALTPASVLGGHLVSGHVDGVGEIILRTPDARSVRFAIRPPQGLMKFIARKGSIAVDGISLTVNAVSDASFEVNIVPHTLDLTVMGEYRSGSLVNLEVDLIARYVERLLQYPRGAG